LRVGVLLNDEDNTRGRRCVPCEWNSAHDEESLRFASARKPSAGELSAGKPSGKTDRADWGVGV